MARLLFGSFDAKHFHPKLMELIRDREDIEAMEMIRGAAAEYNTSRLTDSSGSTLLHHAAKEGNEVVTMYLLSLGFNVNTVDRNGKTPLMLAVLGNRVTTVEILINAGPDIYMKFGDGKSLAQAVFDGTIECYNHIVEMFVYKVLGEHSDPDLLAMELTELKCPLYYVMDLRNPVITKMMLERGSDVNDQESRHGNTALHRAVYFRDVENVKLLLAHGADVNVKDKAGRIPWRCVSNLDGSTVQPKVLKMLLDRKPALKSLTANGRMQMYELFARGSEATVKMILQADVDFSGKDGKGDTAFHYLATNANLSGAKLLPVGKSRDVDSRNNARLAALHVAAMSGKCGAMKFLLNSGARVDHKTGNTFRTALFCAVRSPGPSAETKRKCVELLLERGADVQFVTPKKKTALDVQAPDRDDSVVRTLLAHLAMIEASGTAIVPEIREKIDNCERYKSQFGACKKQLEDMKRDKIHESLTLFELLVGQKADVVKHVRGDELKLKLKNKNNNDSFDAYYNSLLRKRINRAVKMNDLFE